MLIGWERDITIFFRWTNMNCHPHRCVPVYVTAMVFLRRSTEIAKTLFSEYFVKQESSLNCSWLPWPRLIPDWSEHCLSSSIYDINRPFQFDVYSCLTKFDELVIISDGNTSKFQDSLCLWSLDPGFHACGDHILQWRYRRMRYSSAQLPAMWQSLLSDNQLILIFSLILI